MKNAIVSQSTERLSFGNDRCDREDILSFSLPGSVLSAWEMLKEKRKKRGYVPVIVNNCSDSE